MKSLGQVQRSYNVYTPTQNSVFDKEIFGNRQQLLFPWASFILLYCINIYLDTGGNRLVQMLSGLHTFVLIRELAADAHM